MKIEGQNQPTMPMNRNAAKAPAVSGQSPQQLSDELNRLSGADLRDAEKNKKSGDKMGKDEFLKLFMEQLKHQDPMSPMKGDEFSQHMAMFSQLEQQINMNQNLEKLVNQKKDGYLEAVNFIGKDIEGGKTAVTHQENGVSPLTFNLPANAREIKVNVLNDKNEIIRTVNVGEKQMGLVTEKWDGKTEEGEVAPTGSYQFKVEAKDMSGNKINVASDIKGRVTGITTDNGRVYLLVGDQKVAMSEVQAIREANSVKSGTEIKKTAGTESEASSSGPSGTSTKVEMTDEVAKALAGAENAADVDGKKDLTDEDDEQINVLPFWMR